MLSEVRDKWVDNLRSGRFKKTMGNLCDVDPDLNPRGYCCLGVLLETLEESFPTLEDFSFCASGSQKYFYQEDFKSSIYIPAGFSGLDGNKITELTHMNDGYKETRRHSFVEIADWIETNIPTE